MTTSNKNFKVKNGLEVLGTSATVDGNDILTTASNIEDLANVDITGAVAGNALVFDSSLNLVPGEGGGGGGSQHFISDTKPLDANEGDTWFNSITGATFIYYVDVDSSQWVQLGDSLEGQVGPQGLTGPQGEPGADGAQGDPGADGPSAYDVAVNNGFVGTEQDWLDSLVGPQGEQGTQGDTGPAGADGLDGSDGIVAQATAPTDTDILWLDTSAPGYGIPAAGTTGQILAKASNTAYDTEWITPYTQSDATSDINAAISGLIDSAPTALDTLNELSAALNDDANFAGTVTTALSGKANISGAAFTGDISSVIITSKRSNSVDEGGELRLAKASDNSDGWMIDSYGSSSTPDLRIFDSSGAVRLRIDGSGRVMMAYQPSFLAVKSDNGNAYSGDYVFNTAMHNTGGHYSTSTGRFTAPVAGRYFFITEIQTYGIAAGTLSTVSFKKNNAIFADGSGGTPKAIVNKAVDSTYHNTIVFSLIMDLAANDYVNVYTENSRGMQSHFSGYLIG